jgi:hypothetical protein
VQSLEYTIVRFRLAIILAAALAGSFPAHAASLTFTCAPNMTNGTSNLGPAGTCAYLNTTIAGLYTSTFSNVNARIYIQYGSTSLGQSEAADTEVPYSTYVADLTATSNGSAIDTAALASLAANDTLPYGCDDVDIPTALGTALGLTGLIGTTAGGASCRLGTTGCYNGIITITNDTSLLYYRSLSGGSITGSEYDFFSVVEHETDEVLGTASCIDTTGSTLADGCDAATPSAVDLFRYNAGVLVTTNSAIGQASLPAGAYFSYNGGVTNGADGATYNTAANGLDYADFTQNCAFVQDTTGCAGRSLDITSDGGAEIDILEAVGYQDPPSVPEPSTIALFAGGVAMLAVAYRGQKRA